MSTDLNSYNTTGKSVYHFSFLKDIKVHGVYFNSFSQLMKLYCFLRKEHAYDFYSVTLFTEGNGYISIGHETFKVHAGTLCMLGPGDMHSLENAGNTEGLTFFFCEDFYAEEFSILRLLNLYSYTSGTGLNNCSPCIELTAGENQAISQVLRAINEEYVRYSKSDNSLLVIRSQLNILILKLSELLESRSGEKNLTDSTLVHSLSKLIDSSFIREHQIGFYTSAFNISESQLNELCNRHFNCSMKKILQNRLMQEARKLLLFSDLTVSEIAFKLNFEDNSYFNKVFKSRTGLTPKKFRDIHKRFVPQNS